MTKLIAGNWKMFKGPEETLAFFDAFEAPDGVDVVLCPPFVSLEAAVGEEWPIYAQNVHWAEEGQPRIVPDEHAAALIQTHRSAKGIIICEINER